MASSASTYPVQCFHRILYKFQLQVNVTLTFQTRSTQNRLRQILNTEKVKHKSVKDFSSVVIKNKNITHSDINESKLIKEIKNIINTNNLFTCKSDKSNVFTNEYAFKMNHNIDLDDIKLLHHCSKGTKLKVSRN